MNSDDIELLAYVDGTLSTHERDALERRLAASSDVASRIAWLEASRLPYAQAFAQQRLPPVPPSLERMIGGIAQAARLEASAGTARKQTPQDSCRHVASGRIAAAFVAGALIGGAALHFFIDDARLHITRATQSVAVVAPWVDAAMRYQQLYSRATLADVRADRASAKAIVARIRHDDALAVDIPDLSAYGLTFKRVQRLRFNGQALVQIVYLPEHGDPVALCMTRETQADAIPAYRAVTSVASMAAITWWRAEVGYALIGASDDTRLDALAQHIADDDTAPLFNSISKTE
jgi:anti-sigma factor RsiW